MDLRNSNGIGLRSFYFTTVLKLFRKISPEVGKSIMWGSIQVLPNQASKKSFNLTATLIEHKAGEGAARKLLNDIYEIYFIL